jgi:hypothetical protein
MDLGDSGRTNVIVTDLPGATEVMFLRTDLPRGGSCSTDMFPGLCANLDTDAPITFADACSGLQSPFGCEKIKLFWLQDSRNGLLARTPQAAKLVSIAKDLKAGDETVLIASEAVAIVGKASTGDERNVRITHNGHASRSMTIPASSVSRANLSAAMSTLYAAGFALEELTLFGDDGRVLLERGGAEFFLDPPCGPLCTPKRLLVPAQFEAEYRRRFQIVPVEGVASPNFPELRRTLTSALVTPGFRKTELERQSVLQSPEIYLLEW